MWILFYTAFPSMIAGIGLSFIHGMYYETVRQGILIAFDGGAPYVKICGYTWAGELKCVTRAADEIAYRQLQVGDVADFR